MPNLLLDNVCSILSWDWDFTVDPETIIQYWVTLLVIIRPEVWHIIRRLEISTANKVMSIEEAGNELEILLFGDIVQQIEDLDSIFLLDLSEQLNNEEAFRLRLPDKSDSSGLLKQHADFTNRLVIGNFGTTVWQPQPDLNRNYDCWKFSNNQNFLNKHLFCLSRYF